VDQQLALSLAGFLISRLPPGTKQRLEAVVSRQGFDTFCLGYLLSNEACAQLSRSVETALGAIQRNPQLLPEARRQLYACWKLDMEIKK